MEETDPQDSPSKSPDSRGKSAVPGVSAPKGPVDRRLESPDRRSSRGSPDEPPPPRKDNRDNREDHSKENPDSFGRMEEEGREDELPKDLPKVPTLRIVIIVVVLVLLLAGLFLAGYIPHHRQVTKLAQKSKAVQAAKPSVEVVQARRTDAAVELELPGNAVPLQQTSIYPRANGYLKRLYVDIGDHVTRGQLLAEIDTPEIDAQLAAAKANVIQSDANLTRAQKDYDLARTTLDRYTGFFNSGGVTRQQFDERQNAFNQAVSTLEGAQAAVASAKAEVQRLSALTGFEKIFAPFDGVVAVRNFDVGALLNPSNTSSAQQLFEIDRTDVLRVFVNVPQVYATEIRMGQPALFDVRNYPRHPFLGTVVRSAGALDPRTRTLRMQVNFANKDDELLPGMYGQVMIDVPRQTPQLVIPTSALIFNAEGLRVGIVDAGHKAHFRKIVVGRDFGTEVEVLDGLTGQEQIIANPGERLTDGVEVNVSPGPSDGKASQGGGRNGQDVPNGGSAGAGRKETQAK